MGSDIQKSMIRQGHIIDTYSKTYDLDKKIKTWNKESRVKKFDSKSQGFTSEISKKKINKGIKTNKQYNKMENKLNRKQIYKNRN